MFHAIKYGLKDVDVRQMGECLAEFMNEYWNKIESESGLTIGEEQECEKWRYIEGIRKNRWGSMRDLISLSDKYKFDFTIYTRQQNKQELKSICERNSAISTRWVGLVWRGSENNASNHYDAIKRACNEPVEQEVTKKQDGGKNVKNG